MSYPNLNRNRMNPWLITGLLTVVLAATFVWMQQSVQAVALPARAAVVQSAAMPPSPSKHPGDLFNWREPVWLGAVTMAQGGCVSLTTLGSAYTQNFDTLSNTAGSTTNNLTITGWSMTETGGGARDNEQYAVDTGASTTGDTFSYGAAASTERALGGLRSGTLIPNFGACFTNNTGATIGSLATAYTGEEWRFGTTGRADQLNFEYSTNAVDLTTGTWTNVAALNFVTPDTATVGAKNGNAAADRTALSSTISSLSIPNGATFWIRWTDIDVTGADDGLAVDDFSLTPQGAVILPNLTINDVSLNEGNAGTTSFTFTVSLSAPAGAGGVTFDIATADGTATQPSDYTQKTLTAQTIPAGSSTYSFTVLVNGDTTPETNETFFVNVTNVTGATVTDGQGQGSGDQPADGDAVNAGPQVDPEGPFLHLAPKLRQHCARRRQEHGRHDPGRRRRYPGEHEQPDKGDARADVPAARHFATQFQQLQRRLPPLRCAATHNPTYSPRYEASSSLVRSGASLTKAIDCATVSTSS